jgi:hypothetical protein
MVPQFSYADGSGVFITEYCMGEADAMITHTRETSAAWPGFGVAATCCVALACAAYVYYALDPAATARATLDTCVRERLAQRDRAASPATAAADVDRKQALSAALYACSTQP